MKKSSLIILIVSLGISLFLLGCLMFTPLKNSDGKTYCKIEQRGVEACTMEYNPVCGWSDSSIKCFKYPCAQTFSNVCSACSDLKVEYYTAGECPK